MDFSVFDHPRPSFDADEAARIALEHYGIVGAAEPLAGERDRSFRIASDDGHYVLKIGNRADHPNALEAQAAAIEWALTSDPGLPLAVLGRDVGDSPWIGEDLRVEW